MLLISPITLISSGIRACISRLSPMISRKPRLRFMRIRTVEYSMIPLWFSRYNSALPVMVNLGISKTRSPGISKKSAIALLMISLRLFISIPSRHEKYCKSLLFQYMHECPPAFANIDQTYKNESNKFEQTKRRALARHFAHLIYNDINGSGYANL